MGRSASDGSQDMTLARIALIFALASVAACTTFAVNNDFILTGVSGAMMVFRTPLYAQVLALALLVATSCAFAFLKKRRRLLGSLLVVAAACYALSLHTLSDIVTIRELIDHYPFLYRQRLSIVASDAGLPGFMCTSKGPFFARFVNEKGDGAMNVFLGVYPWRIDGGRFDELMRCR